MKYCIQCGQLYAESSDEYEREICANCGMQLTVDETTTEEQFLKMSESEKDAYEENIYSICRKSDFWNEKDHNHFCNKEYGFYYDFFRFDKYEKIRGEKAHTKENALYHQMKFKQEQYDAMLGGALQRIKAQQEGSSNVPKCPTCSSTNIKRISTTSKVAGATMFGLFSKTARSQFKCGNCGYKW